MTDDKGTFEEFDAKEVPNPAAEFVRDRRDHSPIHQYIVDHGLSTSRNEIKHVCLEGRNIALSQNVTDEEQEFVAEAIRATEPKMKECFANAIRIWDYDNRFKYVEGFAVPPGFEVAIEHAWCFLDGQKLVDITAEFTDYFGAVVTDNDTLACYAEDEEIGYGIIGNHHNRFEFLRKRGYV